MLYLSIMAVCASHGEGIADFPLGLSKDHIVTHVNRLLYSAISLKHE